MIQNTKQITGHTTFPRQFGNVTLKKGVAVGAGLLALVFLILQV